MITNHIHVLKVEILGHLVRLRFLYRIYGHIQCGRLVHMCIVKIFFSACSRYSCSKIEIHPPMYVLSPVGSEWTSDACVHLCLPVVHHTRRNLALLAVDGEKPGVISNNS
jgi:hypothetical protein